MARIRTIKPAHWADKELANIPLGAHLFWIGLWNFSDDEGVFENDPLLLKNYVFPRRTDIRVEQISQWLDQLTKARFIVPFTHDGTSYFLHRSFRVHQKIDRPQPSKIPLETIRRVFDESSTTVRPCIVEDSIVRESKGDRAQISENQEQPAPTTRWNTRPGPEMLDMDIPPLKIGTVIEFHGISKNQKITEQQVRGLWRVFKGQYFSGEKYYQSENEVYTHFFNWAKTAPIPKPEVVSKTGMTAHELREKRDRQLLNQADERKE